jgi:hypothetical protein
LKRCSICGTVSPDDDLTCGVCGGDLAYTQVESREEVERDQITSVQKEALEERKTVRRIEKRFIAFKLSEFILGIAGMFGGLYLIAQLRSWYGILVIFLGLMFLFQAIGFPHFTSRGWGWGH